MADNTGMRFSSFAAPDNDPAAWQIRPLTDADVAGLMAVQEACYGTHYL